jgi:hypothetical protein
MLASWLAGTEGLGARIHIQYFIVLNSTKTPVCNTIAP